LTLHYYPNLDRFSSTSSHPHPAPLRPRPRGKGTGGGARGRNATGNPCNSKRREDARHGRGWERDGQEERKSLLIEES